MTPPRVSPASEHLTAARNLVSGFMLPERITDPALADDLAIAIAELLTSVAQSSGWQPIETRPANGTYLVANEKGQVAPWIRGVIHNNVGTAWDWSYGEAIVRWMPLPTYSDSSTIPLPVVTTGLEPDPNSASGYRVTSKVQS